jgi:hypothetical protein
VQLSRGSPARVCPSASSTYAVRAPTMATDRPENATCFSAGDQPARVHRRRGCPTCLPAAAPHTIRRAKPSGSEETADARVVRTGLLNLCIYLRRHVSRRQSAPGGRHRQNV